VGLLSAERTGNLTRKEALHEDLTYDSRSKSLPTNAGQFRGKQATSPVGDRPGDNPDRAFFLSFYKKTLELKKNQLVIQVPLSGKFAKKNSQIFSKSTRSPTVLVEGNLQIKP